MVVAMSAVQIYLLADLYKTGVISAGSFAFIAMMTLKVDYHLDSLLTNLLFNINPSVAQIKSSYSFANQPITVLDSEDAKSLKSVKGEIELKKGVSKNSKNMKRN